MQLSYPCRRPALGRLGLASLLLSLNGCGGTTDSPAPLGGGAANDSGAGGNAGSGSVGGSAGSGSVGGREPGGTSGMGGVPLSEQPLLPLVSGRRSSFVFSPIDPSKPMTDTCDNPTTSIEESDGVSFPGHTGKRYRTFCGTAPFLVEGEGDNLLAYEIKDGALVLPPFVYIHSPVETGEAWDSGHGDRLTWQALDEPLVTPAGTFQNCWNRLGFVTITYCRGVGLVRATGTDQNYQLELSEKNF